MKTINIKFKGIDNWNRPVFKDVDSNTYYGSVTKLFSWDALPEDVIKYFKSSTTDGLEYFGSHFGCEPHGGLDENITLNIVE